MKQLKFIEKCFDIKNKQVTNNKTSIANVIFKHFEKLLSALQYTRIYFNYYLILKT